MLKNVGFNPIFSKNRPLGRFFIIVAMSVCLSVCLTVSLSVPSRCDFFRGLSLALRSHIKLMLVKMMFSFHIQDTALEHTSSVSRLPLSPAQTQLKFILMLPDIQQYFVRSLRVTQCWFCIVFKKLGGEGPVDIRPSTNQLHNLLLFTCHMSCITCQVTCDT